MSIKIQEKEGEFLVFFYYFSINFLSFYRLEIYLTLYNKQVLSNFFIYMHRNCLVLNHLLFIPIFSLFVKKQLVLRLNPLKYIIFPIYKLKY